MKRLLFICFMHIWAFPIIAQNKIYVDKSATGTNNGTSRTNAYTELSNALDFANSNNTIDTILVATGRYFPITNISGETLDIHKTFHINRSNITLLGGYAPGGTNRDIDRHLTILDGNIGDPNDSTDNAVSVVSINMQSTMLLKIDSIRIDGFHITNGYAFNNLPRNGANLALSGDLGAAIQASSASVHISNCSIYNNKSKNASISASLGNYCTIENCNIYDNRNEMGASLNILAGLRAKITNNTIQYNNNDIGFAGISVAYYQNVIIANNTINENKCNLDNIENNAINLYSVDTLDFSNNVLHRNVTKGSLIFFQRIGRAKINYNDLSFNNTIPTGQRLS